MQQSYNRTERRKLAVCVLVINNEYYETYCENVLRLIRNQMVRNVGDRTNHGHVNQS